MFLQGDHNHLKSGASALPSLYGLDNFRVSLERDYFCDISVRNQESNTYRCDLALGMHCNLSLRGLVQGYRERIWGVQPEEGEANPLVVALDRLNLQNPVEVDIEEVAIFLQDTLITIKNIYPRSVAEQFGHLMAALADHYNHLAMLENSLPYEIYIPVFEEGETDPELPIQRPASLARCSKDYLEYWGLYYETEEDAVIYDLGKRTTITGELYMLNQ